LVGSHQCDLLWLRRLPPSHLPRHSPRYFGIGV